VTTLFAIVDEEQKSFALIDSSTANSTVPETHSNALDDAVLIKRILETALIRDAIVWIVALLVYTYYAVTIETFAVLYQQLNNGNTHLGKRAESH